MEVGAVRVRRRARGPVGQPAVHAIERLERARARRFADDRAKVARVHAPFAGDRALLVGRQPLDLPRRQIQIRKRVRRAAEDPARDARPPLRPIEVDDVCELVREGEAQPVVEHELRRRRPHRVDDDRVVGQRRGVAVRELGLIGEDDVRQTRRDDAERPLQRAPRLLGDCREPPGGALLIPIEVDDEVLGREDAECQRGIEPRGAVRRARRSDGE